MTVERASAGTMSGDDTLPLVIRLFVFADDAQVTDAATRLREAIADGLPEYTATVYQDVMPAAAGGDSLERLWRDANPGEEPGGRRRHRLSVVIDGMSYAELADLSTSLAEVVSPGWSSGDAAERAAATRTVPCRVAVGRADEQPGAPIAPETADEAAGNEPQRDIDHDEDGHRYVLRIDGREAGFAEYTPVADGVVDFDHTVVHLAFQGKGLSKPLIAGALDGARARGLRIRTSCSAVAKFVGKNPDYADLVEA